MLPFFCESRTGIFDFVQPTPEGNIYRWHDGTRTHIRIKSPIDKGRVLVTTVDSKGDLLALGLDSGYLVLVDLVSTEQSYFFVGENAKVTSVTFCGGTSLVVATKNGNLFEFKKSDSTWGSKPFQLLKNSSQKYGSVSAMTASDNILYLAAKSGSVFYAVDSTTGAQLHKWKCATPPISRISAVHNFGILKKNTKSSDKLKNGSFLLITSVDRQLQLFYDSTSRSNDATEIEGLDVNQDPNNSSPFDSSIVLSDNSKSLMTNINKYTTRSSSEGLLDVLSLNSSGTISIWQIPLLQLVQQQKKRQEETQSYSPLGSIRLNSSDNNFKIISAGFTSENTIILSYNSSNVPAFESVVYKEGSQIKRSIEITPPKSSQTNSSKISTTPSVVIGAGDIKIPSVKSASKVTKKEEKESEDDDDEEQDEVQNPDDNEDEGMSFGERLQSQSKDSKIKINDRNDSLSVSSGVSQPKVESLEKLVEQAIQTKDNDLFTKIFKISNEKMIKSTIEKLPQNLVIEFLTECIRIFQVHSHHTPTVSVSKIALWIKQLLVTHTSLLITYPGLPELLAPFYGTVESRLSTFQEFLKLQGRLELVKSQIDTKRYRSLNSHSRQPITTYNEKDLADEALLIGDEDNNEGEEEDQQMDTDEDEDKDEADSNENEEKDIVENDVLMVDTEDPYDEDGDDDQDQGEGEPTGLLEEENESEGDENSSAD